MNKKIDRINDIIEKVTQVIENSKNIKINRSKPIAELSDDELKKRKEEK